MLASILLFVLALGTVSMGPVDRRCAGMDSACCSIQDGTQVLDLRDARCQMFTRKRELKEERSCEDTTRLTLDDDGCKVMCQSLPWGTCGCLDEENRNEWFYCRSGHPLWVSSPGACDKNGRGSGSCSE